MYSKVLKEVVLRLYMCTLCEKAKNGCIYKFCKESIHCTGYPLIQVEIVSICKSHYMYWLVSQSSLLTFPCSWSVVAHGLSPVWLQVQVQVQVQVLLLYLPQFLLSLHLPRFLPFFLQNTELDTEAVFCVVMKTRSGEILLTELCRTKFLSSL